MEESKLTAAEAEFLTERVQLILLSTLPESDRYRTLDGALRKLRTGKSEVDFTDTELRQVMWGLEDLRLGADEHKTLTFGGSAASLDLDQNLK